MKSVVLFLFGTIIPVLLFCSCIKNDNDENSTLFASAPGEAWTQTDTSLDLCIYQIDTLNPLKTSVKHNAEVLSILYDSLFSATTDFTAEMQLAQQYDIATDNKAITVKIRKDVYFSNNSPLTAKDVAASFNTIATSSGYFKQQLPNLIGAKASGDRVTISFSAPTAFPEILLDVPILPNGGATKKETDHQYADDLSPGSGIYTLSDYFLNKEIHLQANQHHFSGIIPAIERVIIHIVKDQKTAVSMMENSRIDMITGSAVNLQSYTPQKALQNALYPGCRFLFIGVNQTPSLKNTSLIHNAISAGIHRANLLKKSYLSGAITCSAIHPNKMSNEADEPQRSAANGLLVADGWIDKTHDGILEKKANGKTYTLSFELLVHRENTTHTFLAETLQKQLAELGVYLKIRTCSFQDYQKKIRENNFDFFLGEANLLPNFDTADITKIAGTHNTKSEEDTIKPCIGICFFNEQLLYDTNIQAANIKTLNPYKSIAHWSMIK